jgi:hypothetical protein
VLAGVLLGLVPAGPGRHRQAEFKCRYCHRTNIARLTQLRTGAVRSCGCRSKACFKQYQEARVRQLDRHTRARFFGDVVRHGVPSASGITGQDRYLLSTAARLHRRWLRNHPALREIAAAARRCALYSDVARRFGITPFCVSYVVRVWGILQEAAHQKACRIRELGKGVLDDLRFTLALAVATILERQEHSSWLENAEFTKSELHRSKKSEFGWALGYLRRGGYVPPDLQRTAGEFLYAVERTFAVRKHRRLRWLRSNNIGASVPRTRCGKTTARAPRP